MTCAVLLVKDEADMIEYTVRYLFGQVDEIIVSDNGSTDGTRDILARLAAEPMDGCWLTVQDDPDPAYHQAEKTSLLAQQALEAGHRWVIPCDADELWYSTDGRRISDFLAGLAPDVAYVNAPLYNHLPTSADPQCPRCGGAGAEPLLDNETWCPTCPDCRGTGMILNPFERIGWRQREHGALPKVACRLRPGLEIRQGNHSAWAPGSGLTTTGLVVRHYSWRSPAQYVQKIGNGYRAYAATSLPDDVGTHWRMFGPPDEPTFAERVANHFYEWFYVEDPWRHPELIYDPAPWRGSSEQAGSRPGDGVGSLQPTTMKGEQMGEYEEHDPGEGVPEPVEGQEELATGAEPAEEASVTRDVGGEEPETGTPEADPSEDPPVDPPVDPAAPEDPAA